MRPVFLVFFSMQRRKLRFVISLSSYMHVISYHIPLFSRHIPICMSFPRLRICMSFPNSTSLHIATRGLEHKLHLPTQLPASFHHGEPCRVSPRSSVRVKSPCWATTRSYGIGKPRKTVRGRQCDECVHGLKRGLCRAYSLIHLLHWQDVRALSDRQCDFYLIRVLPSSTHIQSQQ